MEIGAGNMVIIARQHKIDPDQVELFTDNKRWLFALVHIDHFSDLGITARLHDGEEIILEISA